VIELKVEFCCLGFAKRVSFIGNYNYL